jgi:hypothetical protein
MDENSAFLTTFLVVGSTYASELIGKKPLTAKPLLAGFGMGLFLLVTIEINPELGKALCILIGTVAVIHNGSGIFTLLTKLGA